MRASRLFLFAGWSAFLVPLLAQASPPPPPAIEPPASHAPSSLAPAPSAPRLYNNLYLGTKDVAAHVIVRSGQDGRPARVVVANPAGNTGVGFWTSKLPAGDPGLAVEGNVQQVTQNGIHGVSVPMAGPAKLKIDRFYLDSVRTLRDAEQSAEGGRLKTVGEASHVLTAWGPQHDATTEEVRQTMVKRLNQWFAPERVVDLAHPGAVVLQRQSLGSGALNRAEWIPGEGTKIDYDGANLVLTGAGQTHFELRSFIDRPVLSPLDHVYRSGRGGHMGSAMSFLATKSKILAGSWQYLTYFGRDTLISSALFFRRASSQFIGTAVGSVLDRVSTEGEVAHEEDIGDQAALTNVAALAERIRTGKQTTLTHADLAALEKPIYDYKMVDGEHLLTPLLDRMMSRYNPRSPDDRQMLEETFTPARLEAFSRVLSRIDDQTSHGGTLISLRPGEIVGNWRDSGEGLGNGRFPLDVSAYLVPASLQSLSRLIQNPNFPKEKLLENAGPNRAKLTRMLDSGVLTKRAAEWRKAASVFRVKVDGATAKTRLGSLLRSLPEEDQKTIGKMPLFNASGTVDDALAGRSNFLNAETRFDGIALDKDRQAIPVLSSDGSFHLFYGEPTREELLSEINTVFQPYPIGLATPVGLVAANPGYSSRPEDRGLFGRDKYHGAVVWGWQQSVMREGIEKQLVTFKGDAQVEATLHKALAVLDAAERNVGALGKTAELWSWKAEGGKIVPVAYGASATDATEANDRQLWTAAGQRGSGSQTPGRVQLVR